jgi:hypothetical protein
MKAVLSINPKEETTKFKILRKYLKPIPQPRLSLRRLARRARRRRIR